MKSLIVLRRTYNFEHDEALDAAADDASYLHLPRSLISFGVKQRAIGESAKTQEISNFKNTVGSLKRLAGRVASDPEIVDIESKFLTASLCDAQGTVGVKVCV